MGVVFPTETRFPKILIYNNCLLENPHTTQKGLMSKLGLIEATASLIHLRHLQLCPIQQALAMLWDWRFKLVSPILQMTLEHL
jgi:hypothetical protein